MPTRTRAQPLSIEDRRSAIIDVVIPLIMEHGSDVTTRQIAEAAGVAEGTIFRAFGDKESIIDAAVERFFDPAPMRRMIEAIDPELPLRAKVHDLLFHLQARTTGVVQILGALGPRRQTRRPEPAADFVDLVAGVLAVNEELLRVDAIEIAHYLRLVAFASSVGPLNTAYPFTIDQLTDLIVGGITQRTDDAA